MYLFYFIFSLKAGVEIYIIYLNLLPLNYAYVRFIVKSYIYSVWEIHTSRINNILTIYNILIFCSICHTYSLAVGLALEVVLGTHV